MFRGHWRFRPALQLVTVLACTYAVFHLALYIWLNSPAVSQQRMDLANAAVVERAAIVYRANGWSGMNSGTEMPVPEDASVVAMNPQGHPSADADCFCADP